MRSRSSHCSITKFIFLPAPHKDLPLTHVWLIRIVLVLQCALEMCDYLDILDYRDIIYIFIETKMIGLFILIIVNFF